MSRFQKFLLINTLKQFNPKTEKFSSAIHKVNKNDEIIRDHWPFALKIELVYA